MEGLALSNIYSETTSYHYTEHVFLSRLILMLAFQDESLCTYFTNVETEAGSCMTLLQGVGSGFGRCGFISQSIARVHTALVLGKTGARFMFLMGKGKDCTGMGAYSALHSITAG